METIWKFPLEITARQTLEIPELYRVLHVGTQHDQPCLWVQVDPDHEIEDVTIVCVGTGHALSLYDNYGYIGTVMTHGDKFVWHYFRGSVKLEDERPCNHRTTATGADQPG